jgi:O-antigen/teichoic acid export membrane protein
VLSIYHRNSPERLRQTVERFFKALVLLGWPTTVGTVLLAPGLTHLLRLFNDAEEPLRILAVGFVVLFVNNAFIGALNSMDKQVLFTYAAGISVVVNVALNVVLIPFYGYDGAAWATVLTEIALAITGYVLTTRHLGRIAVVRLSWRPVLAGLVMGAAILPFRDVRGLMLVAVVLGAAVLYVVVVLLIRAVDRSELELVRQTVRPR